MQQTFGQPYDADIDRSHDGGLPLQRQDKFCASAADIQRQDVRYVSGVSPNECRASSGALLRRR
jgi:hypothetical protein